MTAGPGVDATRAGLRARLGFPLDAFQEEALDSLDEGRSVLVSAPTGSGKTVVADYAVARARAEGRRAFYTTPIKALSNQKFAELAQVYGPDDVGLLTGDVSHQADAGVVVMTTEVLRNMLFARSPQLTGLGLVVLDEVHYLQDPYRGSVWEEVIILTDPAVVFVCLSATVSNAGRIRRLARGGARSHRRRGGDAPAGRAPQPRGRGREGHPASRPRAGAARRQAPSPGGAPSTSAWRACPGAPAGRATRA